MLPLRSDAVRRRADRLGRRPCAKTSTPAPPKAASPPTSPASRRSGPGCRSSPRRTSRKAEASGFPIVALILLVVFGSLAAAALPLALGFVSVIVTGALIYFISLQMTTSVFVTNMASMIGIGVAIDYSLFILARYREERERGPRARRGARRRRSPPPASPSPSPASP